MTDPMRELQRTLAEQHRHRPFIKAIVFFSHLVLAGVILGWYQWVPIAPDRLPGPPADVAIHFRPVQFDPAGFAPLKLVGAWRVKADDPRWGGISALAISEGRLLGLSDSGVLFWIPRPGTGSDVRILDLPDGPGSPRSKGNRDTESLTADPQGRGWWVGFENHDQIWLYDHRFERALEWHRVHDWTFDRNRGIEAMVPSNPGLLVFPEKGLEALFVRDGNVTTLNWRNSYGYLSEATRLKNGTILLIGRHIEFPRIDNKLLWLDPRGGVLRTRLLARLPLGLLDNAEAMTSEPLPDGSTRLWIMTDNDFSRVRVTLMIALDLPPTIGRMLEKP